MKRSREDPATAAPTLYPVRRGDKLWAVSADSEELQKKRIKMQHDNTSLEAIEIDDGVRLPLRLPEKFAIVQSEEECATVREIGVQNGALLLRDADARFSLAAHLKLEEPYFLLQNGNVSKTPNTLVRPGDTVVCPAYGARCLICLEGADLSKKAPCCNAFFHRDCFKAYVTPKAKNGDRVACPACRSHKLNSARSLQTLYEVAQKIVADSHTRYGLPI